MPESPLSTTLKETSLPTQTKPKDRLRTRFSSLPWVDKDMLDQPILVIGAGGIGSWTTFLLSRCGYTNITVYDDDVVEAHNIGGQLFSTSHIGKSKVQALASLIGELSGSGITGIQLRFISNDLSDYKFIILAPDNMTTRRGVFEGFKELVSKDATNTPILIDGRLLAEQLQVYFVTKDRIERYESTLFSDAEGEEAMCTAKQTSHFAAGIAYHILCGLNNHVASLIDADSARELPFSIEADGMLMLNPITL